VEREEEDMRRPKNPCDGCKERSIECHGKCEIYKRFSEELFTYNLQVSENRNNTYRTVKWTKSRRKMVSMRQRG